MERSNVRLWGGSYNPFEMPITEDGHYLEMVDIQLDPLRRKSKRPNVDNMDLDTYAIAMIPIGSSSYYKKKERELMVMLTGCAGIKTGKKASPAEKRRPTQKKCIALRRKNGVTERIFARAAA